MTVTNEERDLIIETVGQKWVITFDANGTKCMGMCGSHLMLPNMINKIRESGGKNIVITDKTIFFVDDDED